MGGDRLDLSPTVRLVHLPGHFPGSSALHWTAGPRGRRTLLIGDSLHVAADRRHVTVMHSVPNFIPVDADVIATSTPGSTTSTSTTSTASPGA